MNDTWHFLKEFESSELIKRHIKKKYDYSINTSKAAEIASAVIQGREYFKSSENAALTVKPLLQYYGVIALSRALILVLKRSARENNIIPSHGLKIKNWSDVVNDQNLQDIIVKISNGTFTELINVTGNKTYLRAGSSGINWFAKFDVPTNNCEIAFNDVLYCFPDLYLSVKSWLNEELPQLTIEKIKILDSKYELELTGINDPKNIERIFPRSLYSDVTATTEKNGRLKVSYTSKEIPHISQKWVSHFQVIGDPIVSPPINNKFYLNDISKMYLTSFILGTISRYYPTTWNNINRGIKNYSMMPFAINFMDYLNDKFPKIILDFLNAPYDCDKK